jgi:hypothetical protein
LCVGDSHTLFVPTTLEQKLVDELANFRRCEKPYRYDNADDGKC